MRLSMHLPTFAGGEVSPRLSARSDLAKYASAAAELTNFIVRPEGGLIRRPGTRFLGATRDETKRSRLVPFVFSSVQAYMLEIGDRTLRVWKDLAPVASSTHAIIAITRANPARVTAPGHLLTNGDRVVITGVHGMSELNNREFTVANVAGPSFELLGIDTSNADVYLSGGQAAKIYELATPYLEGELDALNFTQSADRLYLTHPAHAPRSLTRTGHAAWHLSTLGLKRGPFAPTNGDDALRVMCVAPSGFQPGHPVTIKANAPVFTPGHEASYFRLTEIYLSDPAVSPWSPGAGVNTALGTQVSYNGRVYALIDNGVGSQMGSVPPTHTEGDAWDNPIGANDRKKWRFLHDRSAVLRLDNYVDAKTMDATIITYLCNGLAPEARTITSVSNAGGRCRITAAGHGLNEGDYVSVTGTTGATEANGDWKITNVTSSTFDLENSLPPSAYISAGLVKRFATWVWSHGAFSSERGYPACVALHEQRLIFANTKAQPFGVWASATADFENFTPGTRDDETIAYNIAAGQADPIRWLASGPDLLIGTLSQEFASFGGGLGDPMTPSNTRIVPQSGEGAGTAAPVKAGAELIFVNRAGRKIFSLAQQADQGAYVSTDLTELASHLTLTAPMTALAWAKNPLSVLWALRADGRLLSLTYRPEQEIYAWGKHDVGGVVESLAVIPSPDASFDQVWLITRRQIGNSTRRFIEALAPPFEPTHANDKAEMGFLDCALRYQGAPATSFAGLAHVEGASVSLIADGALHAPRFVESGRITLERPASNVWVGVPYHSRVRTLPLEAPGTNSTPRRVARVSVHVLSSLGAKAGIAGATLEPLIRRDQSDPMDASPPLYSGKIDITPASGFGTDASLEVIQDEPLPLDILALTPLVSLTSA